MIARNLVYIIACSCEHLLFLAVQPEHNLPANQLLLIATKYPKLNVQRVFWIMYTIFFR